MCPRVFYVTPLFYRVAIIIIAHRHRSSSSSVSSRIANVQAMSAMSNTTFMRAKTSRYHRPVSAPRPPTGASLAKKPSSGLDPSGGRHGANARGTTRPRHERCLLDALIDGGWMRFGRFGRDRTGATAMVWGRTVLLVGKVSRNISASSYVRSQHHAHDNERSPRYSFIDLRY